MAFFRNKVDGIPPQLVFQEVESKTPEIGRQMFQKTMITLSFKGEIIFHLVMALWHFFTDIYKKREEIWCFIADICKKLEEMEQNILLLTTRDDVQIHEEIESLHKELNAIHVRLSKRKTAKERERRQGNHQTEGYQGVAGGIGQEKSRPDWKRCPSTMGLSYRSKIEPKLDRTFVFNH